MRTLQRRLFVKGVKLSSMPSFLFRRRAPAAAVVKRILEMSVEVVVAQPLNMPIARHCGHDTTPYCSTRPTR